MLNFEPITPADRPRLHEIFYRAEGHGCEYSFNNLFFWGDQRVAWVEDSALVHSRFDHFEAYQFPIRGDAAPLLRLMREHAHSQGKPLRLFGLTEQEAALIQELWPEEFALEAVRSNFDYVYPAQRLAQLPGRKLQAKRNHCNRFAAEHPAHRIELLDDALLARCRAFTEDWYVCHMVTGSDYDGERAAIAKAFDHYWELGMEGIALLDGDRLLGFSMGSLIRPDVFDVNYEKACPGVNGSYATVNRAFARYIVEKYPDIRWINREDDMGLEGLRQAKLSYAPDVLLVKWVAEEKTYV